MGCGSSDNPNQNTVSQPEPQAKPVTNQQVNITNPVNPKPVAPKPVAAPAKTNFNQPPPTKVNVQNLPQSSDPPEDHSHILDQEESTHKIVINRKSGEAQMKNKFDRTRPNDDSDLYTKMGTEKGSDWEKLLSSNTQIVSPSSPIPNNPSEPDINYKLEFAYGFRCEDARQNIHFTNDNKIVYMTAALGIVLDPQTNTQSFFGGKVMSSKTPPTSEDHNDDIIALTVTPKRDVVVSGQVGAKPKVLAWSPNKCSLLSNNSKMLLPHGEKGVAAIGCSYDGKYCALATLNESHNIFVYEIETVELKNSRPGGTDKILDICWSMKSGDYYFVTVGLKHVYMWDMALQNSKRGICGVEKVTSFACATSCPNGRYYTGGANGQLYIWEKNKLVKTLQLHKGIIDSVKCAHKMIITGGHDGKVQMTDWESLKPLRSIGIGSPVKAVDYNGVNVVAGCLNGSIYLIDNNLSSKREIMDSHAMGEEWGLEVAEDNVVTSGDDNSIVVWDTRMHKKLKAAIIESKAGEKQKYGASSLSKMADNQC